MVCEDKVLELIELGHEHCLKCNLDFDSYISGLFSGLDLDKDWNMIELLIKYHRTK
jgi:hypothetical protein